MRKLLVGLALGLSAAASNAQSVLTFDVVFDQVYEASGAFTPNLTAVGPGPFNPGPIAPPNLKARVVMSAVPSGTQLTAVNTITLNGSFSTESGNSPSNGWSVHTFNAATFNLLKAGGNSFFAIDFVTNPNDWPTFISSAANGYLSDHGPAAGYGGTCPYFFGCASLQPGGNGTGAGTFGLFAPGTNIFNTGTSLPSFPTLANAGHYPLASGTYSQTNPGSGLGFDNGMDAFAFQGVLDTTNSQGNGSSQPYIDGVNGYPGIVRILITSTTGNTAYMVQGRVVTPIVDADVDSVADSLDNCPAVANFNQADTDSDLRGNACDNCRTLANNTGPAAQCDSDTDGFGNRCDGDLNNNGSTNAQDTTLFRQQLGQPSIAPVFNRADLNCSGSVNAQDTTLFRGRLGSPPGPGAGP
jgi:hypothetical protein